mmetsp:Transcript_2871/g.6759  ORF Transcript_2871/g.6759 Transcript_2871/m.6759 type:complete len:221 (+) Transcript_2871:1061-1723(+)
MVGTPQKSPSSYKEPPRLSLAEDYQKDPMEWSKFACPRSPRVTLQTLAEVSGGLNRLGKSNPPEKDQLQLLEVDHQTAASSMLLVDNVKILVTEDLTMIQPRTLNTRNSRRWKLVSKISASFNLARVGRILFVRIVSAKISPTTVSTMRPLMLSWIVPFASVLNERLMPFVKKNQALGPICLTRNQIATRCNTAHLLRTNTEPMPYSGSASAPRLTRLLK